MKTKKGVFGRVLVVMVIAGIVLSGCSDGMGQENDEVPANLANTTWTRQIGSETVTLEFSETTMKVQSNIITSVNNGIWYCNGRTQGGSYLNRGGCCYFGNNGYYSNSLDFQYTCYGNTLNIYGCRMQSLNGTWTRL
jgi:hypothetical protein